MLLLPGCAIDIFPRSFGSSVKFGLQKIALGYTLGVAGVVKSKSVVEKDVGRFLSDVGRLRDDVSNGGIYVQDNFLPRDLFEAFGRLPLRKDHG